MKTYTAGSLVSHYRAAMAWAPDRPFVQTDWCTVLSAREWLSWFRERLEDKINRTDARIGRKLEWQWQRDCRNMSRDLMQRIVVRKTHYPTVTRDLRGKVDHRLDSD